MTDLATRAAATFLAGAVGDALGWPQENRSSNVDRKMPAPAMAFRPWRRRGGGRFHPYEEEIAAGDYSDDTQMLCAVARSLARGISWYEWLTTVELPTFALYQRGAGKALLAACRAWSAGVPPWEPHRATDPRAYFNAGGNGGAMRILPHALAAAAEGQPLDADRLFGDVTATHGHPRAAVGAALQAAALHVGLTFEGTLGYGELIDALIDRNHLWASMPATDHMPRGWLSAWSTNVAMSFEETWQGTVNEMMALLVMAQKGMRAGALASEQETLRKLGCTGTITVGSGTVSAAGAVYLASRSAANPRAGVLAAAYLQKADTDTLASMTASILTSFAGREWMAPLDGQVQDRNYIIQLAAAVLRRPDTDGASPGRISKGAIDRFTRALDEAALGQTLELVDGRTVSVDARERLRSKTESADVQRFRLLARDGQSLHVVRVRRRTRPASRGSNQPTLPIDEHFESQAPSGVVRVGVKISVAQLDTMRRFYEQIMGMSPTRQGETFVTLNDIIALSTLEHQGSSGPSRVSVYLDVLHIEALWRRVQENGIRVVDPLKGEGGRQRFRCLDPEGNLLEVREVARGEPGDRQGRHATPFTTTDATASGEQGASQPG